MNYSEMHELHSVHFRYLFHCLFPLFAKPISNYFSSVTRFVFFSEYPLLQAYCPPFIVYTRQTAGLHLIYLSSSCKNATKTSSCRQPQRNSTFQVTWKIIRTVLFLSNSLLFRKNLCQFGKSSYFCALFWCSVRLAVRTPPFHGGGTGSIPVRCTHTKAALNFQGGIFIAYTLQS